MCLFTVKQWVNLVAYGNRFQQTLAHTSLSKWNNSTKDTNEIGNNISPIANTIKGHVAYVTFIEKKHPGYTHHLFQYAHWVKCNNATFEELATVMNEKSATPGESWSKLELHWLQVWRWFVSLKGWEYSTMENPFDTPTHCKLRIIWARTYYKILAGSDVLVTVLKKWFCTRNCQHKIKLLLFAPHETKGDEKIPPPKIDLDGFQWKSCSWVQCPFPPTW